MTFTWAPGIHLVVAGLRKIKIVQYGLGPTGIGIVETLLARPWIELVGAIDTDATKAGRDIGDLLDRPRRTGIIVSDHPKETIQSVSPDVVTHATSSYMTAIYTQIEELLKNNVHVISTAEELVYPFVKFPELARNLDSLAESRHRVLLGTGVNPGYILDTLAVVLSGACQRITAIRAERVVDTAKRRLQLQKRTGAGLAPAEFNRGVANGSIKHVGLPESVGLVALAMGWKVGEIQERITPILAEKEAISDHLKVAPGAVAGVRQVAKGILAGHELVVLDLKMYLGAPNPHDSIIIEGVPPIDMTIKGGVQGDRATSAIVVNSIARISQLQAGLRTMIDLPPVAPRTNLVDTSRSVMLTTF